MTPVGHSFKNRGPFFCFVSIVLERSHAGESSPARSSAFVRTDDKKIVGPLRDAGLGYWIEY